MAKQKCGGGRITQAELVRQGTIGLADAKKLLTPREELQAMLPPWEVSDAAFALVVAETAAPEVRHAIGQLLRRQAAHLREEADRLEARAGQIE